MKISRGEITITDVPGVEYIKVKMGNVVTIKFTYFDHAMSYGSSELVHLRDALTVAIDAMIDENGAAVAESAGSVIHDQINAYAAKVIASTSPTAKVGDVFTAGDDEPSNVLEFIDSECDIWKKGADGKYHYRCFTLPWGWERIVNEYGPLTVTEVSE